MQLFVSVAIPSHLQDSVETDNVLFFPHSVVTTENPASEAP